MTVKRKLQQANSASSELETVKAKLAEAVSAFSVATPFDILPSGLLHIM